MTDILQYQKIILIGTPNIDYKKCIYIYTSMYIKQDIMLTRKCSIRQFKEVKNVVIFYSYMFNVVTSC